MTTLNPFDILVDDDSDDLTQLIAAQQKKIAEQKTAPADGGGAPAKAAKMPSKPLPPFQAVREAKSNAAAPRGGVSSRGGPGRGRGARDFGNGNADGFARGYGRVDGGENGENRRPFERERGFYGGPSERDRGTYDGPRQPFRGGRRGGDGNEETGGDSERPRRTYERRSGTGRGYENKRDGAGRGNWGNATDDALTQEIGENVNAEEKIASHEKQPEQDDAPSAEADKEKKEGQANEAEEKEKEDKEMTLEEYEKIREEKRKALLALKTEERKVEIDNELKSMHLLSLKKENDPIFVKLGSDKKKKESAERDEKVKKSLSINEFLKPAEGERYYGRGRGRGRGDRGPHQGGYGGGGGGVFASAPAIEDPGQFPTLGGK